MNPSNNDATTGAVSRRVLLTTAFLPAAGVFAQGSDVIRVGVIGCGGRGEAAAMNAMNADPGVKVVAMADLLLRRFPGEAEGQLARRHAALVSTRTLAEIVRASGLNDHLIAYRGAPSVTQAILADTMEALLGAVFVDAGFATAAATVERLWGERLGSHNPAPRPPKTQLQEWAQARGLALPAYRQIGREGTEHEPMFLVEVSVGAVQPVQGRGRTKREAESDAARLLIEELGKS